jgi:hypothetical protein
MLIAFRTGIGIRPTWNLSPAGSGHAAFFVDLRKNEDQLDKPMKKSADREMAVKPGYILSAMNLAICFWILATGAGFCALTKYEYTPGEAGIEISDWPTDSLIVCDTDRANLVVAVHPHCPCSRATIDALAQAMTRCQGRATAHVLFYRPAPTHSTVGREQTSGIARPIFLG